MFFGSGRPALPEIDARELAGRLSGGGERPFLVDVREPHEFAAGRLEGAVLIPLGQLPSRLDEIPQDEEVVLVCRSGARSGQAARLLMGKGYRVLNLRGGMLGWSGPVVRGMVASVPRERAGER